jgi:hypothetical protein
MTPPVRTEDQYDRICPLLIVAALMLCIVPALHPNNTCHDWLEKWGQLADDPMWLPIHKTAAAGFAMAGVAGLLFAVWGRPSWTGLLGGAALGAGHMIQAALVPIHSAAVSSLGRAFNAAVGDEARREAIRTTAEAFVAYDVAACGVTTALVSAGAVLTTWTLYRAGVFSWVVAAVLSGVGALWGIAYYHGVPGEWVPYSSVSLWLAGTAILILIDRRRRAATTPLA